MEEQESIERAREEAEAVVDQARFAAQATEQPVPVRIIAEHGPTALVEWAAGDDVTRAYVPKEVIAAGSQPHDLRVDRAELDAGTAYGVRWEELAVVTATPAEIGRQLRRHGIWTRRDLELHIATAQAAFMEAYGADLGALLVAVRKLEGE